nr:HAD-IB family phosphatase [uncultured Brevundimonas sp.]
MTKHRYSLSPSRSEWAIHCDFDGTISDRDATDSLLQAFGRPGWTDLENAWEQGQIGSKACMTGQIALLDMTDRAFDQALSAIQVDSAFPAFVRAAQGFGAPISIVSDGLDLAIERILAPLNLGALPVMANQMEQVSANRWRLNTPWSSAACVKDSANCKCARLAEARRTANRILYIGDSTSDFCVSGKADFVLAKRRLIDHCRANAIPHAPIDDFTDALALLPEILSRPSLQDAV